MNLVKAIYDQMLAQQESHERKQHWYPSGISAEVDGVHVGKCKRALYYDLSYAERTNPMDAPALFKCNVGDLIHNYLDGLLAKHLESEGYENLGAEIPVAWNVEGLEFPFSGRMDYLFKAPNGDLVGVEWKSTYGRGFDIIKKNGVKIENLIQCCCYLEQTVQPLSKILLLYVGRDNGYIIGFVVSKDEMGLKIERMVDNPDVSYCPLKFEHIVESCKIVERCVKEGILPKKDFKEMDWQCSYCSYHDRCKGETE